MKIKDFVIEDLIKIHFLIEAVDDTLFVEELPVLSNATIGKHIRHILEFYLAVINRTTPNEVSFDDRRRDLELETCRDKANEVISDLQLAVSQHAEDQPVILKASYSLGDEQSLRFTSSVERELAYALEHSIHHQAIIKIGLSSKPVELEFVQMLGVSPATTRYRQKESFPSNTPSHEK
jgi:uncharacterized damage-inducible protein DinB